MRTAIRKHAATSWRSSALLVVALARVGVHPGQAAASLPGWVPVVGKHCFTLKAELSTAQAVTPGQGQTVNIAGVAGGRDHLVKLVDGSAIVGMNIQPKYDRIYKNATILLRPKTGLKDMVAELDAGHAARPGSCPSGGTIPISQTLPDVNLDEILASLDTDTRDYLLLLLNDGAQGVGSAAKGARPGPARCGGSSRPRATRARSTSSSRCARGNIARVVHNFRLLTDALGAQGRRSWRTSCRTPTRSSAPSPPRTPDLRSIAAASSRATLTTTQTTLGQGQRRSPTRSGRRCRRPAPAARARSARRWRQTRPFLRETTPIIQRPDPAVHARRAAHGAGAAAGAAATWRRRRRTSRRRSRSSTTCSTSSPTTRRASRRGLLSGRRGSTTPATRCSPPRTRTGPIRRGLIVLSCQTAQLLKAITAANPQLATLIQLLDAPTTQQICPSSTAGAERGLTDGQKTAPVGRQDPRDGDLRAVVLRPAAVPVAGVRRPDPAQAEGLPLPHVVRRGRPAGQPRPTCASPACRSARSRDQRRQAHGARPTRRSSSTPKYAPMPTDAKAILRQKTLLGETYVELTPGSRRRGRSPRTGSWPPPRSRRRSSSTRSSAPSTQAHAGGVPGLDADAGAGDRRPRPGPQRRARQPRRRSPTTPTTLAEHPQPPARRGVSSWSPTPAWCSARSTSATAS